MSNSAQMSSQIPVVIVGSTDQSGLEGRLAAFGAFPIVSCQWEGAAAAIADVRPGAVVAELEDCSPAALENLARACESAVPYTPLLALGPSEALPRNALPFAVAELGLDRLDARLSAALRV